VLPNVLTATSTGQSGVSMSASMSVISRGAGGGGNRGDCRVPRTNIASHRTPRSSATASDRRRCRTTTTRHPARANCVAQPRPMLWHPPVHEGDAARQTQEVLAHTADAVELGAVVAHDFRSSLSAGPARECAMDLADSGHRGVGVRMIVGPHERSTYDQVEHLQSDHVVLESEVHVLVGIRDGRLSTAPAFRPICAGYRACHRIAKCGTHPASASTETTW
jgi:hypothetical protein